MIRTILASALAASIAAPSVAAAAAPTTVIDLGGSRGYVQTDPGTPLAAVQLFVNAGLNRETGTQNGLAALVAELILRSPAPAPGSKQPIPLVDAITAHGGSLSYAVSSGYVRFNLQAAPETLPAIAPLLARVLAAPSYDPATLAAARTALTTRIASDEQDPRLVGLGMLRASYYRDGSALPVLGTPASLMALSAADARAFHDRWYVRGNSYITAVGRTGDTSAAASRTLIAALPSTQAPPAPALVTRPFNTEPRRLLTHRDVLSPYVVLGFAAPSLGDRDFAATLVVRSFLADVFVRPSATTRPLALRGIGTIYGYDAVPAQFALWINGALLDPSTGLGALSALVKATGDKPLPQNILDRYKQSARGEWQLEALSLEDRAWSIGNAVSQGLDPDTASTVEAAIAKVTSADVQRVAKRYFQKYDVALILPRTQGTGAGTGSGG
ncbi:MAG TPA: pitrilysin family protein [Candidatus Acidoferrum sp.]|nr:pitrilysin family protein [Candidatus Acidoferrum sp.]